MVPLSASSLPLLNYQEFLACDTNHDDVTDDKSLSTKPLWLQVALIVPEFGQPQPVIANQMGLFITLHVNILIDKTMIESVDKK